MNKLIILTFIGFMPFVSCTSSTQGTYDCTNLAPNYIDDVKPILDNSCATSGCHNSTSKAQGLDYSSYSSTKKNASSNAFMGSMEHRSGYKAMPQGRSKLSNAELEIIYCWTQNGFLE